MGPKWVSCGRPSQGWSGDYWNWSAVAEDADPRRHNHCRPGKHHVATCRHSHAHCRLSNRCCDGGKSQIQTLNFIIINRHSNINVVNLDKMYWITVGSGKYLDMFNTYTCSLFLLDSYQFHRQQTQQQPKRSTSLTTPGSWTLSSTSSSSSYIVTRWGKSFSTDTTLSLCRNISIWNVYLKDTEVLAEVLYLLPCGLTKLRNTEMNDSTRKWNNWDT